MTYFTAISCEVGKANSEVGIRVLPAYFPISAFRFPIY